MQNYYRCFMILIVIILFNIPAFADEDTGQTIEKADLNKQISYALGYNIVNQIKENFELDPEFFIMGVKDSKDKKPGVTKEKLQELLVTFQQLAKQNQMKKMQEQSIVNLSKGLKFLDENKKKEGVVTLSSGLQYKVLSEGTGPSPKASDTVECDYEGTLIDGTVFDSSYKRGRPEKFPVNGVIKGWTEALQKMKTGSTWMLYVPADLAYGSRGAGAVIKPGSTLVFKVELLGIVR